MAVVNVTQACNELSDMVDRVQDGERIVITSKNRNAVLMSEEECNSLMETLHLLSDPDTAADLYRTRRTPLSGMEAWECPDTQRSWKHRHAVAARGRGDRVATGGRMRRSDDCSWYRERRRGTDEDALHHR